MKFRTVLLGLAALFVAFNAAFFSVSGLSKLFAGASVSVIVMASSLELAKLITAGYLYNYWEKINKAFRIYLSMGVVILILITSLGIYGFLTSAFQDTFNQFSVKEKQLSFLQQKESYWEKDVARYDVELNRISENISTLSNAKTSSIQVRDTSTVSGFRNTISTTELRISQKRIEVEEVNRKLVQSKREVVADSLQTIQLKILKVESSEGVSSELGPLQYLSGLLNRPMDVIINWFILIIIFVFDPLAVALVIAFNNAVLVDRGIIDKKQVVEKRRLYDEEPDTPEDLDEDDRDEWDEDHALDMVMNEMVNDLSDEEVQSLIDTNKVKEDGLKEKEALESYNLDYDGDGVVSEEELKADTDGDGILSEDEQRAHYENTWKRAYRGSPYWSHPWFDWKKTERWINDREAINYWLQFRGGNQSALNEYKTKYPTDFNKKTY